METRLAVMADAVDLASLHADSFGAARWSVAQISDSLALPTTLGLVVCAGGEKLGFILCQTMVDEAEILTFCTAPAARQRGVGSTLLSQTIVFLRAKDVQKIFLEVAVDNHAALALYHKFGFTEQGRRNAYYPHETGAIDAVMLAVGL